MRVLLLIMCLFLSVSCNRTGGKEKFITLNSYISSYYDGPFDIYNGGFAEGLGIVLSIEGTVIYYSPEKGGEGESAEKFLRIAARNGDRSYNRSKPEHGAGVRACADNFKSVRIVCLRGSWDEDHPQGSLLNDLAEIQYWTYAEYIRNGYEGLSMKEILKPVSELSEDDLSMISPRFGVLFDTHPSQGEYELEVTLVTTEGKEKTATCVFDFGK